MFDARQREAFQWNEKLATMVGSFLLAGMMVCVGISLHALGLRLFPTWDGGFLPWLCLLISLEAIFSEGRVRHFSLLSPGRVIYRISEVILLTVGLKLFLAFYRGENIFQAISVWREDFPFSFMTGEFGGLWAIIVVVWVVAGFWGGLLYDLVEDTDLIRPGSEPQFFTSRREIRRRLAGQIFFVGAGMVVMAVLTRVDIKAIWGELPPVEANAVSILSYFFLAFLLLSQGQFAVLRASWIWQNISVTRPIAMGWLRYSLVFLGVLALLVLILPTGYSVGLFALFKILFSFILTLLNIIFFILMLPILWLINFLARMRGTEEPFSDPFENLIPTPTPADAATPIATLTIPELIRSILFWGIFLLVCGYALVQYFRQNQELLERLRQIPGLRWLVDGMNAFLEWLRGATRAVTDMAVAGWARVRPQARAGSSTPWRMIRPNRLPPREQVMFYYLALVRRGRENRLPRGIAQTPQEYSTSLQHLLPEQSQELSTLTDAFLEARYTRHPISEETASRAKTLWEKLRGVFRGSK